jgi:hypothetical protein
MNAPRSRPAVGLVLGLEVSRLARNSADWHRLIDLGGLTDTLTEWTEVRRQRLEDELTPEGSVPLRALAVRPLLAQSCH